MKHTTRNWFWGIFLILGAVLIVASQFGTFIELGFWSILAGVALLAVIIQSLVHLNFFGVTIPLGLLYLIFQKPLGWYEISFWVLMLSAVILGLGLQIIFRRRPKNYQYSTFSGRKGGNGGSMEQTHIEDDNGGIRPEMRTEENDDENHPYAKVSFGAASKYLHSTALVDGQFSVSFGAMEIYFDNAQLAPGGADIFLDCSFGAMELYVPRHWRVKDNLNSSLAGVENDTRRAQPEADAPELRLNGNVSLGGIEIKYV